MEFLIGFFTEYGYWAVLFVLIICGFGVPIPEDITLVSVVLLRDFILKVLIHI